MTYEPNEMLRAYANGLGESSLKAAGSFKTKVFIGEKLVFKLSEQGRGGKKEEYVLKLLSNKLSSRWRSIIPDIIEVKEIEGLGIIQVHTRLQGEHPKEMSEQLAMELGQFLSALHGIRSWDKITEFEGGEEISFTDYLHTAPKKFSARLEDVINANDSKLIAEAINSIEKYAEKISTEPKLVLIHKDIHLDNLLVGKDGELTGVIDWGAAQTGPKEWEFAILKQRIPEYWNQALKSYTGQPLDLELLDICGLIQSLRFWKSFPQDEPFVAQQREYIKMTLVSSTTLRQ